MSERDIRLKPYGATTWDRFTLAPANENHRGVAIQARPWQPGDKGHMFRIPLHPWTGGMYVNRLGTRTTYAKANADASNDGLLLHPPKVNDLTFTNGTTPNKMVDFDSNIFILVGRYVYRVNPSTYAVTEDKDFGVGNAGTDMVVFNNELIVAMGESTKIWKRDTSDTWTQATDNTFAIALGVVGEKLWRAESTHKLSSCTSTPLTLASWVPASPNQYKVGDSTYAVNTILDYGGIPWVGKADGMWAPDPQARFLNQTPQLSRWPDTDNCKGAFTGWGYLWVPSVAGLIRINPGNSKVLGPELTFRPDFRFRVRGGVEFNSFLYLLVTDTGASGNTFICKMSRNERGETPNDYIYHEWARLGGTSTGLFIGVSTQPTNPTLIAGYGDDAKYIKLGRGGGRDVDDANYDFGTAMELETGVILPGPDRTVVHSPVGVEVTLDYSSAGESLTIAGKVDGGAYGNLLDTQEGGGSAAISSTTNVQAIRRFFAPGTQGQHVEVKFTSALTSASGTSRPEIYEAWLFGFHHPSSLDSITCRIVTDSRGQRSGMTRHEILDYFRHYHEQGKTLEMKLADYEEHNTVRVVISDVGDEEVYVTKGMTGGDAYAVSAITVEFTRADYAGAYAHLSGYGSGQYGLDEYGS